MIFNEKIKSMSLFKKIVVTPVIAALSFVGSYLASSVATPYSPKWEANSIYCATPLADIAGSAAEVNLGVIIEGGLEGKIGDIEKALRAAKNFYAVEFGIQLNITRGYAPVLPEYDDPFDLPIPANLRKNNAHVFIAEEVNSLIKRSTQGFIYMGESSNAKRIVVHRVKDLSHEAIAILLEHEIAHLFYAEDIESGAPSNCLMSRHEYYEIKGSDYKIEICEPARSTIMKFRNRIW
ncbi:hypothetical protein HY501_01725 [Candidatus Woesearchaeota archaeon]|nr:hypothetical protein [Candidatus Woesearchaeota archaeon]